MSAPPLSELTTLRLGGPPARLLSIDSEDALLETVRAADGAGEPLLLLAGGSNVVVADAGFEARVGDHHVAAARQQQQRLAGAVGRADGLEQRVLAVDRQQARRRPAETQRRQLGQGRGGHARGR